MFPEKIMKIEDSNYQQKLSKFLLTLKKHYHRLNKYFFRINSKNQFFPCSRNFFFSRVLRCLPLQSYMLYKDFVYPYTQCVLLQFCMFYMGFFCLLPVQLAYSKIISKNKYRLFKYFRIIFLDQQIIFTINKKLSKFFLDLTRKQYFLPLK